MIGYLMKFLETNSKTKVFDKKYREGYNKLWINNLKNYCP